MASTMLVVVLVMAMVTVASAGQQRYGQCLTTCTFSVAGRKFKLDNVPFSPGTSVVCPEGNPSTVTFCKKGAKLEIVGNFQAAGLGLCPLTVNPYAITPTEELTYAQYGDMVVINSSYRVATSIRCFLQDYKMVCVGGSFLGVSYLTDMGPAKC